MCCETCGCDNLFELPIGPITPGPKGSTGITPVIGVVTVNTSSVSASGSFNENPVGSNSYDLTLNIPTLTYTIGNTFVTNVSGVSVNVQSLSPSTMTNIINSGTLSAGTYMITYCGNGTSTGSSSAIQAETLGYLLADSSNNILSASTKLETIRWDSSHGGATSRSLHTQSLVVLTGSSTIYLKAGLYQSNVAINISNSSMIITKVA